MLNDARVASLGFFKDNVCTNRINKEKNFKIKFQVLLKFAQILSDYMKILKLFSFGIADRNCDYDPSVAGFPYM